MKIIALVLKKTSKWVTSIFSTAAFVEHRRSSATQNVNFRRGALAARFSRVIDGHAGSAHTSHSSPQWVSPRVSQSAKPKGGDFSPSWSVNIYIYHWLMYEGTIVVVFNPLFKCQTESKSLSFKHISSCSSQLWAAGEKNILIYIFFFIERRVGVGWGGSQNSDTHLMVKNGHVLI